TQAPLAAERGQRLVVTDVEQLEVEVVGDRQRVHQVFTNLTGNAMKFTPPGGSIVVRADVRGAEVCFSVRDSGPGISEHERAHIFERYWRASDEDKDRRGQGLGLSIAKGIVESLGGRIWVESALGA